MYHKIFGKIKRNVKTHNIFETFNLKSAIAKKRERRREKERERDNTVCIRVYIRRLYTVFQRGLLKHLTAG